MSDHSKKPRGPILAFLGSARLRRRVYLVVLTAPLLYIASFGPACWMAATPRVAGKPDVPRFWMRFYYPFGAVIHRTQSQNSSLVRRWITWGAAKGGRVIVPTDTGGVNWYGFTAE